MDTILRNQCAVTGCQDLEPLYRQEKIPVFMGCVEQSEESDIYSDMDWWISRSSGLIQLRQLLPLDVLYPAAHGAGAVGALWKRHHREFAHFIHQYSPLAVLEIGGASGILAQEYQQLKNIDWTIIEPNPAPVSGCNARFIKGFFDNKFIFDKSVDTIVHSHVFEHIYDIDQFMRHLSGFIGEGQRLLFSLPNLHIWLERRYTTCINFEHTVFLTEPYVEYLLAKYGFRLVKKDYFMEDHSIFY
ncbi:MAG: class I SAM-dependent methyltransferase, partial [Bacteroidia bacterium]